MSAELILLGTGNAQATRCFNTCFILENDSHPFLVDGGGGNGILIQLEKAGVPIESIHNMFLTHGHTDHILGVIWVVRMIATAINKGTYEGNFNIYCHAECAELLRTFCNLTLQKKMTRWFDTRILFHVVEHGDRFSADGMKFTCFDIFSTKMKQFGFLAQLPDGTKVTCCGDEPYNEQNRCYTASSDWMLCEAFCLYADRARFKPYEKHHSTSLDAGRLASDLNVKNLLLYHTEDKTLATRKATYSAEAREHFSGNVFVPDDLERIPL